MTNSIYAMQLCARSPERLKAIHIWRQGLSTVEIGA